MGGSLGELAAFMERQQCLQMEREDKMEAKLESQRLEAKAERAALEAKVEKMQLASDKEHRNKEVCFCMVHSVCLNFLQGGKPMILYSPRQTRDKTEGQLKRAFVSHRWLHCKRGSSLSTWLRFCRTRSYMRWKMSSQMMRREHSRTAHWEVRRVLCPGWLRCRVGWWATRPLAGS
jgi:hypothetical protein